MTQKLSFATPERGRMPFLKFFSLVGDLKIFFRLRCSSRIIRGQDCFLDLKWILQRF